MIEAFGFSCFKKTNKKQSELIETVRLKIGRLLVHVFLIIYPGQNGNVSLPCQQVLDDILSRIQDGQVERVIIILYTHIHQNG